MIFRDGPRVPIHESGRVVPAVEMIHNHTSGHKILRTLAIGGDEAEIELESVGQGRNPLRPSRIFRDHNGILPIGNVQTNPSGYEGLGMEIVDRALEESLHLRSVKIDGNDMLDTCYMK